jgi:catechol 2,3-dioxygenase-like lactoylglutathione lyase family enzyme
VRATIRLLLVFIGCLIRRSLNLNRIAGHRDPDKADWLERRILMLPIRGIYEVAIRVRDLPKAEAFYRRVLGLQEGLRDERRNWLFLRAGGADGMIVLQEDKGEWPTTHFAFTVAEQEIEEAAAMLRAQGVEVEGPVYHEWMPARSIYFSDPDGHALELCAPVRA